MANVAHQMAIGAEKLWDRVRPRDQSPEADIQSYVGYGTPEACVLRGRVLDRHRYTHQIAHTSLIDSVRNMARNFLTDEMAGVTVRSNGVETVSDEEGYFQLSVPRLEPGWHNVSIELPEHGVMTSADVVVPSNDAKRGVISDIDDTVIKTGAYWLPRNLWTTLTTAIGDRIVFDDTVGLLRELRGEHNPVFYVSSSPWNLHSYLTEVFRTNDVPRGPLFLRDLGVSDSKFIKSSHSSHKVDAIDTILSANPDLTFTLIGDTGQHDAIVYRDVVARHPGRIDRIVLRHAGEIDEADDDAAQAIRDAGVDLCMGASLGPALADRKDA